VPTEEPVTLGQVAEIAGPSHLVKGVEGISIEMKGPIGVISDLDLMELVTRAFPHSQPVMLGSAQTLVIRSRGEDVPSRVTAWRALAVSLLLFVGSAMAMVHFHADVNMPEVHQRIQERFTTTEARRPVLINVAYSLGIGIGIGLFFNRLPLKGARMEPGPLEVESYLYQRDLDECLAYGLRQTQGSGRQKSHGRP